MAENTILNAGAGGDTVAADDIGGIKFQRLKLVHGVDGINAGDVATTNPLPIATYPVTSGGLSPYHKVAAASNNAVSIKGAAGQVYGIKGFNLAAYPVFVKIYDKATAPNPATDTPIRTVGLQAGVRCDDVIGPGLVCALGIAIAIVKGIADTDNTAVLAQDCVVDVDYK